MRISSTVAAIELDDARVRVVVLKTTANAPRPVDMREVAVTADEGEELDAAIARGLAAALKDLAVQPVVYVLSERVEWSVVRRLTIPFKGQRRVASAVPFELEPHLAFPIEELVVDFSVVGESGGKTDVIAVGLRRDLIERHLAIASEAGVYIEGIGLDALGLSALWFARRTSKRSIDAVLHVRDGGATLVGVIDGKLSHVRHLTSYSGTFDPTAPQSLPEIQNALRAFAAESNHEEELTHLEISGLHLDIDKLHLLEENLGIGVGMAELANPGTVLGDDEGNAWSGIAGAAFTASGGPFSLNFLKPEIAPPGTPAGVRKNLIASFALVAVLVVTFWGFRYAEYKSNTEEVERIGQQIWDIYAETFPGELTAGGREGGDIAGFKSFDAMQAAIDEEQLASRSLSPDVLRRPTLLDLIAEVAKYAPDGQVKISDMRITLNRRPEITLIGESKSPAALSKMLGELEGSNLLKVDPNRLNRASTGGKETFTVVMTY